MIDTALEKKEILKAYRNLLRSAKHAKKDAETKKRIRKAFEVAVEAHKNDRRKSGEAYIFHPIAVARICAEEIGLGATSIICALLHDTVEDTDITLKDVENIFGKKEALIIDGLTKISGVVDYSVSLQAENFRKILLTLSKDVRVILIKIADRLHNMRTIGAMRRDKQLKIASETLFLYAPLAHRLGLHSIKSELEDLSLQCQEPEKYDEIESKLKKTEEVRRRFIRKFSLPIKKALDKKGLDFQIKGRSKSIYSIWNKMNKKDIPFEEVYDLFAIRIIVDSEKKETEKSDCWQIYSVVTDFYQPNIDRLRDWISAPKANGYESLHTTVMSPTGKWVEVQIRTKRMDDIAEKGFAAHWKYKEGENSDSHFDTWINQVRELLENNEASAIDLIDGFKLNLFSDEIYVFTPNGEMKSLPYGATALDFAFEIHTQIGERCLGAKVNNKLVPLSHHLNSGDQIEILTSKKQRPREDWLTFVQTHKAKSRIKSSLKNEKRIIAAKGKLLLDKEFKKLKISHQNISLKELQSYFKVTSALELFYLIAKEEIDLSHLKGFEIRKGVLRPKRTIQKRVKNYFGTKKHSKETSAKEILVIGDNMEKLDYKLAHCCNPIPGDEVYGFITVTEGIKIHKTNCPNTVQLMSNYAYRVIKARWINEQKIAFLSKLKIIGIDELGIVNTITQIISTQLNVNMSSIKFESNDGIFNGIIMVFVKDTTHLTHLINNLKKVKGVEKVERINHE